MSLPVSWRWVSLTTPPFPQSGSSEPSSPAVTGTMKALRLPSTYQRSLICFASAAHGLPPQFVSRRSAPGRSEVPPRPGFLVSRHPNYPALPYVDATGISQVSRRSIPCLCCIPGPRSNRRVLVTSGHVDAAPAIRTTRASALAYFEADSCSFGTCSPTLRATLMVTRKAGFRLADWPLPGGS